MSEWSGWNEWYWRRIEERYLDNFNRKYMSEEKFEWTDSLVREFTLHCGEMSMNDFKQSKLNSNKDWEIMSVSYGISGWTCDKTTFDWYLKNGGYIDQLKRLSDGEIFTVGDYVLWFTLSNKPHKIAKFSILDGDGMHVIGYEPEEFNFPFLRIKKVKQPLFKTEDGVDIYYEQQYWSLNTNTWQRNCWTAFIEDCRTKDSPYKFFSTEQAAKDYIIMNKPCLSLNDVVGAAINSNSSADIICYVYTNKLKQLVEQKINAKI